MAIRRAVNLYIENQGPLDADTLVVQDDVIQYWIVSCVWSFRVYEPIPKAFVRVLTARAKEFQKDDSAYIPWMRALLAIRGSNKWDPVDPAEQLRHIFEVVLSEGNAKSIRELIIRHTDRAGIIDLEVLHAWWKDERLSEAQRAWMIEELHRPAWRQFIGENQHALHLDAAFLKAVDVPVTEAPPPAEPEREPELELNNAGKALLNFFLLYPCRKSLETFLAVWRDEGLGQKDRDYLTSLLTEEVWVELIERHKDELKIESAFIEGVVKAQRENP